MGRIITRKEAALMLGLQNPKSLWRYVKHPRFPKHAGWDGMSKLYDEDDIIQFKKHMAEEFEKKERSRLQESHACGSTGTDDERDANNSPCMWTDFVDGSFNQMAHRFLVEHGNRLLALQKECQALEIY